VSFAPKALWAAIRPYRLPGAALAVAIGLAAWFGPTLLLGPRVPVVAIERREFVQTVVASGHVEAPHRVEIGAQIIGVVAEVPVAEGQSVTAGQPLVQLDGAELKAAVQQADAAVQQALARVRQLREVQQPMAQQSVRQAQVTLDNARAQWQRQQDLFNQGFIGQAVLDDARKGVDMAEAQWRSAQSQLESAAPSGSDSAVAETALALARASAEVAKARLGNTTLAAPADGVLISRSVERGDVVQPGKVLMVLSPAGATELVVQIDEKNLALLARGQAAQASADAYADSRFAAVLNYINPGIDAQRGSVEVKLRVLSPPAYLRQDMTVSVDIEVARRPAALLVPTDAVHDVAGKNPWVLKVEGRHAVRQPVTLGVRGAGVSEVLQGLELGDRIVPGAVPAVGDGGRLRAVLAAAP